MTSLDDADIKAQNIKLDKNKKPKTENSEQLNFTVRAVSDVGYIAVVPTDEINPYDKSHFPFDDKRWDDVDKIAEEHQHPNWSKKSHVEGIELCKKKIEEGFIVRPILVFSGLKRELLQDYPDIDMSKLRYQRLDGFKRYMALRELGYKWIVVQVINTWIGGGQEGQPWVL